MIVEKKQEIALRRNKVYISKGKEKADLRELVTITEELKAGGYILSPEVLEEITREDLRDLHTLLMSREDNLLFSGDFVVLYPGFPSQVMEMDKFEAWENARRIYDGELKVEDFYTARDIEEADEGGLEKKHTLLRPMTEEDLVGVAQDIMKAGNSIGETQKEELAWFLSSYPDLPIPSRIPFKETLCIVMSYRPNICPEGINDILRYSMWKMGADPSLPSVPKEIATNSWDRRSKSPNPEWRKLGTLRREERKHILGLIEEIVTRKGLSGTIPDAKGHRFYGSWMLLAERIHVGDYREKYPKAAEFFQTLLTPALSTPYKTWWSKIQGLYDQGKDVVEITEEISKRPGELVRRIDSLLRRGLKENKEGEVFDVFLGCKGMANKTLLELDSYYDKAKVRAPRLVKIMEKSGLFTLPPKEKLEDGFIEVVQDIIHRKILLNINSRITEKDLEGKIVVLDPEIKRIPIPKDMRNTASYIPRGTEFKIPGDKNIVGFFVQWIQEEGKTEDLDLHGYLCNDSGKGTNIGWNTSLKGEEGCAVHSGDVIDTPGKCQETIIFDLEKCREEGYKYIVGDVCNYKGRGFNTLPARIGYTFLPNLRSVNKNTVTRNPDYARDLTNEGSNVATFLINLEERTIQFLEVELEKIPTFDASSSQYYTNLIRYFTAPCSFTSYEIMEQHYTARGALIIPQEPEDERDKELVVESWTAEEVAKDYVKVLGMIGE